MTAKSFFKTASLIAILLVSVKTMYAQTPVTDKHSAVQVSFVPPVSTNGKHAAQYTNAFSFNLLVGVSKNERALTLGGLSNIIKNNSNGLQMAGLFNRVGNEGSGVLLSGLANHVNNNYSGLQFAGLANIAGDVDGFQVAGLVNIAKNVSGVQLAGLVNIAENSDYPIGLLNLIRNGEYSIAVTYDETGSTLVSLRSGGRVTYGILGAGYNHVDKGGSLAVTGGIGAHINISPRFRINNEITGETIGNVTKKPAYKVGYALLPAFRIGQHFELFGGASLNYMHSDDVSKKDLFTGHSLWKDHSSTKLRQLNIGYQVGMQYIF